MRKRLLAVILSLCLLITTTVGMTTVADADELEITAGIRVAYNFSYSDYINNYTYALCKKSGTADLRLAASYRINSVSVDVTVNWYMNQTDSTEGGTWIISDTDYVIVNNGKYDAEAGTTTYYYYIMTVTDKSSGEVLATRTVGPIAFTVVDHDYTSEVTKEATCTEAGEITYTCTECGETKTETIDATGHNMTHYEAVDATCTTDGNIEYWYCSNCYKYFSNSSATAEISLSDTVLSAKGHALTHVEAQLATCTAEGNSEYWYCSNCDKYFSDSAATAEISQSDTVLSAKGHSYGDPVFTWASDYTCTATFTCDEGDDTQTLDATVTSGTTAATCTTDGEIAYTATVTFNGTEYTDTQTEAIAATGHNYGEPVFTWASDYTCTATFTCDNDSSHVETVDCDIATRVVDSCITVQVTYYTASVTFNGKTYPCDETKSAVTGDKVEHNFTEHHEAVDPTCTEYGYYEYWFCDTCNRYYIEVNGVKQETSIIVIGATGHSMTHVEAKDATCTEDGNIEYWHCANCDKYFSDEDGNNEITDTSTIIIGATGHSLTYYKANDATCTADGNTEYWYCETCKKYFSDENATTEIDLADTVVTATGHTYGEPVFTWNGNTCTATFTCTCGDVQTVDATVTSRNFLGVVTYTAKVEFENETYTTTKTTGTSLLVIQANYTAVNEAIAKANALNASDYSNFADVTAAINAVQWNLNVLNQATVNGYAEAIETAISNLKAVELTEETVTINEPIEDTNTETEPDDEPEETEPETNPTTGIALALLPMAIALAATVAGKRR